MDPLSIALLTKACHSHDESAALTPLVATHSLEVLRRWAGANHVEPIVGTTLAASQLLSEGHDWLTQVRLRGVGVVNAFRWLESAVAAIGSSGSRAVVIESAGAVLASGVEETRFCSSDIDLLIPPDRAADVHRVFLDLGSEVLRDLPRVHRRAYSIPDEAESGPVRSIEIATSPFCRKWTPVDHGPIDWFALAKPDERYPGLLRLPPTSALVFQAVHASLHYYRLAPGLRLHAENQWLVSHETFDWDEMGRLAQLGRFTRRTGCALQCLAAIYRSEEAGARAHELLGRSRGIGGRWAASLVNATECGGGRFTRGLLEPLLDDRGSTRWLRDLVAHWAGRRKATAE
jgi:hypothetical protein